MSRSVEMPFLTNTFQADTFKGSQNGCNIPSDKFQELSASCLVRQVKCLGRPAWIMTDDVPLTLPAMTPLPTRFSDGVDSPSKYALPQMHSEIDFTTEHNS